MRRAPLVFALFALIFALLVSACVTRRELATPTMEHALQTCAVGNLCESSAECSSLAFDDVPLTEFLDEVCTQAEIVADTVKGKRYAE